MTHTTSYKTQPHTTQTLRRFLSPGALSLLSLVVVLLVSSAGCVVQKNPVSGNKRAYAYSWDEEVQLGKEADGQIIAQYGLYDDDELTAYVERIGQELLDVSHLRRDDTDAKFRNTPFTFRVLDSPVINAFALPGGFVYVTRGLMAHMENEAQLAVVLGHEIAHVAARHASQRALSQQARQLGLIAGAVGGQAIFGGETARSVLELGGLANQFITLSYSRDAERESDNLGVEYAARLGYDASEGAGFFRTLERLGEQSGQEIPGFMSSHPDPGDRNKTIQRTGVEWSERVGSANRIGREALLEHIDGIVYGEDPRQGFVRDGSFNHPQLAFRFPVPSGWQVMNQPTLVALVPESQEAYVLMTIDSEHDTAREAAEAFASDQNLTIVQSGVGQAGGLSSRFVIADATDQEGNQLRLRAQFIDYDGNVYAFMGVTTQQAYDTYSRSFVDVMQGFRRLTDRSLLAVQPDRVDIRTAQSQSTLQQLLSGALPEGVDAQAVAILNQLQLEDVLSAGTSYKDVD